MSIHRRLPQSENHIIQSLEYADAPARLADTGLTSADVGRIAHQLDSDSFWILRAAPGTWERIDIGVSAVGDVVGPASSTANALPRFDGTTGKIIKDSAITVDASGNISLPALATVDGRDISEDAITWGDHIASMLNPHGVTKAQVSLGNVPNLDTTDAVNNQHTHANKAELDLISDGDHDVRTDNPHGVTPSQVGNTTAQWNADKIQGLDVSTNAPADGQVLEWNSGGGGMWIPATPAGAGGGEANTVSNVGTAGVGLFKTKIGVDLQFKNINAGSNKISITDDVAADEVDIDINEGNIIHQNLDGAGTYTHTEVDTHIGDTTNPHSTSIANLGSGTLAQLNSIISNATLDDAGDSRDPNAHYLTHQDGGADEINVGGLSGLLADAQTPILHAITHQHSGADEIATVVPAANAIPKALAGGRLGGDWITYGAIANTAVEGNDTRVPTQDENDALQGTSGVPSNSNRYVTNTDARLTDARTPVSHATTHESGGVDEMQHQDMQGSGTNTHIQIDLHIGSASNPHSVTSSQVGNSVAQWNASQLQGRAVSNAAPANYQALVWNSGSSWWEPQDQSGGAIFGDNAQFEEQNAEASTTATTPQQRVRLTTGTLPAGTYHVEVMAQLRNGSANKTSHIQAQIDDTKTFMDQDIIGDQYITCSAFTFDITVTSGIHTVDIDYWASSGSTAYIRNARIKLWRVS